MKQKPNKKLQRFPIVRILLPIHVGLMCEDTKLTALRDGVVFKSPSGTSGKQYFLMDIDREIVWD